jgi:diguanylate cyclase (GGDEF)-like protein
VKAVLAAGLSDETAAWLARRLSGVTVEAAATGAQATAALEKGGWSLVIVDDALPGLGGRGLLRAARGKELLRGVPVFYALVRGADAELTHEALDELGIARLLFHPLDREELARQAATLLHAPPPAASPALADAVAGVWEKFRDAVLARVDAVEGAAIAVLEGTLDADTRRHAEREAHKLAGSVGTFGFAEASRIAREAEGLLQGNTPLGQAEALRLTDAAVALRRELSKPPALSGPAPRRADAAQAGDETAPAHHPLVLVVDDDPELTERLAMEAAGRGLRARVAASVAEARAAVAEEAPAAVLLDLSFDDGGSGLELLAELAARTPSVPVVVLTAHGSFTDRVEVARRGGLGFLQKPVPPAQAVDAVEHVLERGREGRATVLAVDDDPQVLDAVERLLAPTGVLVTGLDDPLRFWEALEATIPDAVLLDVDMPHVGGVELCRVMRNDARWSAVPVLFLTGRTDPDTIQRVFAAGADDFVAKPLVGPELVTRVRNRLERVQLHRNLADTDPLTGAANRRSSEEAMSRLMRLAARQTQPFSLGLIDLDHFKEVNDRCGHGAGDDVLRRVAKVLQKSFRAEDVVARWGGEEFVVGMYGMEKDDGVQRLADALEMMRDERFFEPDGCAFHVTFSGGVAQYPLDGSDLQALYRSADAAMYQAKDAGRNRILPAGWTPEHPDAARVVDVLVVEDDPALARLLLHALTTRGYRHEWVQSGKEALGRLTGSRPEVRARVVLLDVDLPELDGHAVLRALARERVLERTRVIMLTVRSSEQEVVQTLEMGAYDHVAKPFSVPILLQRIRRALRSGR